MALPEHQVDLGQSSSVDHHDHPVRWTVDAHQDGPLAVRRRSQRASRGRFGGAALATGQDLSSSCAPPLVLSSISPA